MQLSQSGARHFSVQSHGHQTAVRLLRKGSNGALDSRLQLLPVRAMIHATADVTARPGDEDCTGAQCDSGPEGGRIAGPELGPVCTQVLGAENAPALQSNSLSGCWQLHVPVQRRPVRSPVPYIDCRSTWHLLPMQPAQHRSSTRSSQPRSHSILEPGAFGVGNLSDGKRHSSSDRFQVGHAHLEIGASNRSPRKLELSTFNSGLNVLYNVVRPFTKKRSLLVPRVRPA